MGRIEIKLYGDNIYAIEYVEMLPDYPEVPNICLKVMDKQTFQEAFKRWILEEPNNDIFNR